MRNSAQRAKPENTLKISPKISPSFSPGFSPAEKIVAIISLWGISGIIILRKDVWNYEVGIGNP